MSHVVCTLFDLGERYFNPIPQVPGGLSPFRFGAAADGMALCEDVNGYLPARHPYRLAWNDFLRVWIVTD